MCDTASLASAFGSLGEGIAGRIDARSRGDFAQAQMETAAILASAEARGEETALRKSFAEQASMNAAAIAVTGLDAMSFEGVERGNEANLAEGIATIERNAERAGRQMRSQGRVAKMEGRWEGAAALFQGFIGAGNTLEKAEQSYRDNNTGETRVEYMANSFFRRK